MNCKTSGSQTSKSLGMYTKMYRVCQHKIIVHQSVAHTLQIRTRLLPGEQAVDDAGHQIKPGQQENLREKSHSLQPLKIDIYKWKESTKLN